MDSTRKTRRTQEERSSATREVILRATVQCLIEQGYAATTTTSIQLRAGVSRGALTHHFPSKAELMVAAIRYLVEARIRAMTEALKTIPPDADRIEAGIRLLWSETFENGDLLAAAMELWAAARTDEQLHRSLLLVERELAVLLRQACVSVFGEETASAPGFEAAWRASLFHLRGAALTNIVRPRGSDTSRYLEETIEMFRALLAHGSQAGAAS